MKGIKKFRDNCDRENKSLSNKELFEKIMDMLFIDDYSYDMTTMSLNEADSIKNELKERLTKLGFFEEGDKQERIKYENQ